MSPSSTRHAGGVRGEMALREAYDFIRCGKRCGLSDAGSHPCEFAWGHDGDTHTGSVTCSDDIDEHLNRQKLRKQATRPR